MRELLIQEVKVISGVRMMPYERQVVRQGG